MREISKQETKLIQGIMNGEKNAEIELIKRFKKGLIWLSKRKVENDQVDDIVQETFKNLFKSIRRGIIKPGIPLKDYIFGIFKKVLAEYIEAKKKDEIIMNKDNSDDFIDKRTPEIEYLRKEKIDLITKCIESLPKKYQEIVVLHYLEGYSVKEISALTNLSIGTICYRLHIGRKKILKKANKKLIFADL
jgi:RNA polymerase sigma-70 factor (ECF subfamily)